MMVAHESSNLSETNTNFYEKFDQNIFWSSFLPQVKRLVSYIQKITTPKTPLYETTQQAEGKVLLYLRQSPSARKLPYSSMVRAPQKMSSTAFPYSVTLLEI
jgi:hypothetical protein